MWWMLSWMKFVGRSSASRACGHFSASWLWPWPVSERPTYLQPFADWMTIDYANIAQRDGMLV